MAPRSVIVATLLLAPSSVWAADLPKQGTDSLHNDIRNGVEDSNEGRRSHDHHL
jgi:hypothetical protein